MKAKSGKGHLRVTGKSDNQAKGEFSFKDIAANWGGGRLSISNSAIERVFDLSSGMPRTTSIKNPKSGAEFASPEMDGCDFHFIGYNRPGSKQLSTDYRILQIGASRVPGSLSDGEHVRVTLEIFDSVQSLVYLRDYIVYPDLPAIASQTSLWAGTTPRGFYHRRKAQEFNKLVRLGENEVDPPFESCADAFKMAPGLKAVSAVKFIGRTDINNDLALETPVDSSEVSGNILFLETPSESLWILQEAPPSDERRDFETYDFKLENDGSVRSCCWGISPLDIQPGRELKSYRHAIGFGKPGLFKTANIKRYQKARFPVQSHELTVTVNPWGSTQFPKLLSEKFLLDEIAAAGRLGATHYQIDDRWQKGRSLFELSCNNRKIGSDFWEIDPELFPDGFENIRRQAQKSGVELALWLAPSCNQEYRDWREFAELVWMLHLKWGFRMFKIDAVTTRTKEAEDNLERMFRELRERSGGKIFFNMDTTNGMRPGYLMFQEHGNVFVENRYTTWGLGYHPESALRNFWNLAKYLRPQKLQFEFPNYAMLKREFYDSRGVSQPDVYSREYWAAIPLFANPLAWLSPSLLDEETLKAYAEIIKLHKDHRAAIFTGEIFSVGAQPDGKAVTGFQSHNFETGEGYLIVFRERLASESGELELAGEGACDFKLLHGKGGKINAVPGTSKVSVALDAPGSFALYRYKPSQNSRG